MESFDSLGEFMDLDLLDHLGDAMLLNDRLLFLGTCVREGGREGQRDGGREGGREVGLNIPYCVFCKFMVFTGHRLQCKTPHFTKRKFPNYPQHGVFNHMPPYNSSQVS